MFESDFMERVEGRQSFVFDDTVEMCSQNDFIRFLHYLSGCGRECAKIASVETCVSLLHVRSGHLRSRYIHFGLALGQVHLQRATGGTDVLKGTGTTNAAWRHTAFLSPTCPLGSATAL